MENLRPPMVGRSWSVVISQGTLSSHAFLMTSHPATGVQVWQRAEWGTDMSSLTEGQILDELWAACTTLMEQRTHLPN